ERVLSLLEDNSIFNVLDPVRVPRNALVMNEAFEPDLPDGNPSGLSVTAFTVTGKPAWYLENTPGAQIQDSDGDTIGIQVRSRSGQVLIILTACAIVTPELLGRLSHADLLFFDGTLWRDDEMIR